MIFSEAVLSAQNTPLFSAHSIHAYILEVRNQIFFFFLLLLARYLLFILQVSGLSFLTVFTKHFVVTTIFTVYLAHQTDLTEKERKKKMKHVVFMDV